MERRETDWRRIAAATWSVIGWLLLGYAGLWLVGRLWTVVLPLAIGLLIVFFLRPPVEFMVSRGIPRLAAVLLAYAAGFGVAIAAIVVVAPVVAAQADEFAASFPEYAQRVEDLLRATERRWDGLQLPGWLLRLTDEALTGGFDRAGDLSQRIASRALELGSRALGIVTGLITGLVIGFYLLYSLPRVGPGILSTMPRGWRRDVREAGQRIEDAVGGFVRGQMLISAVVGVLTWLGMLVIGMPFALLLGFISGVGDLVPFVGPVLASVVAAIIGLFVDPWLALGAVVVILAVQQLETTVLQPNIMGKQTGLHPAVVILAIIAGTSLFGFTGLLLAVPTVAALRELLGLYAERHGWQLGEGVPGKNGRPAGDDTTPSGP